MSSVSCLVEQHPFTSNPTGKEHWVFISHAGEQKRGAVAYLRERLLERCPALKGRVFLDEDSLKPGQIKPLDKIYACLQDVFVVIVWLSKEFVSKQYPMQELQLLMHWQQKGSSVVVLPVFYDITHEEASAVVKCYHQAALDAGNLEDAAKNLPEHLFRVKAAAETMVGEGRSDCFRQWAQDLEQLLNITCFRRDQVQDEPQMRDKVVEAAVDALNKLGTMKAPQPQNHLTKILKEGMLSQYEVLGLIQNYLPGSRAWLLTKAKEWLGRRIEARNRLFLLLAGPGMGKSVFCAMLTQKCSSDIAAHHFFKAGTRSAGVKGMMCSILHQLAQRLPSANSKLTQLLEVLEPGEVEGLTTKECFENLVQPVVYAVDASEVGAHGVVVLLDALDEAEVVGGKQEVVNFLTRCLSLPVWLRLLVSTRPELAARFKKWQPTVIEPSSTDNLADLKDVIAYGLKSGSFLANGEDIEDATNVILQKSEGVFIYSKFMFDDLLKHPGKWKGAWTLQDLQQQLPVGTNAMFEAILKRAQEALQNSAKDQHLATPFKNVLLPVLATMMAPLSIEELSWVTGMEEKEVELLMVNHLPSLFPLQPDSDGVRRARPYHKTVTDLLLATSKALPPTLSQTSIHSNASGTVDECSDDSEDEAGLPGPEDLLQPQPPTHPPSSWAVDAQAGHSQFVDASLPELNGIQMQHWQQPCTSQVPHARYVLPHIVPHMVAAGAWKQLHQVLCRTLPALKALVEAQQVPALMQHLCAVKQDPEAARKGIGEAGIADIRTLLSFLTMDQQELQSGPHQLLQEAWNSPSICCLHDTVRSVYAADQAPEGFWRSCVQWCNPPPIFPATAAVLQGHDDFVTTCTLTADGSRLVSGSDDGTLRVWDMSSLKCLGRLHSHTCGVTTCMLTADDSRLVSAFDDGTLCVWDMSSLECLATLLWHTGRLAVCTLTADGSRLVSSSVDGTLHVWDMSSLKCVGTLQGHTRGVTTCTLAADGSRLVSGSDAGTLWVWDMSSLKCLRTLLWHTQRVTTCTLTADGSRMVSGSDDRTLCVWDMSSLNRLGTLSGHSQGVTTCTLTADGSRLLSGSKDGTLRMWDMSTLEHVGTLQGHTGRVTTCMLTADGSRVVSGSHDGTLRAWKLSSLECLSTCKGILGE